MAQLNKLFTKGELMKNFIIGTLITLGSVFSTSRIHSGYAHSTGPVAMELTSGFTVNAGISTFSFDLIDDKANKILKEEDLAIVHEKKVHVFIFDAALKEYHHVHPQWTNGHWEVEAELSKNGKYRIWAQGMIKKGEVEFYADEGIKVVEGLPQNEPAPLGDVRTGRDGVSVATLDNTILNAGQMEMPYLNISRSNGTKPELTPYLGALAHVLAVSKDGETIVHVHPMDHGGHSTPNKLMLHMQFPKAGEYRLWAQFQDAGVIKTVELSVVVKSGN